MTRNPGQSILHRGAAAFAVLLMATAAALPAAQRGHTPALAWVPAAQAAQAAEAGEQAAQIQAAQAAATAWLGRFDAGDYGATWDSAGAAFRKAVTREQWVAQATSVRQSLGDKLERSERGAQFSRDLPGVPPGDYVVIQYASRYSKSKAAMETVTLGREAAGDWRPVGYFVR